MTLLSRTSLDAQMGVQVCHARSANVVTRT